MMAWPKTKHFGDVTKLTEKSIMELLPHCAHIKIGLVGGGFPCHEFGSLKEGATGLSADQRLYEISRVAKLIKKVIPGISIKRFYENPTSMTSIA